MLQRTQGQSPHTHIGSWLKASSGISAISESVNLIIRDILSSPCQWLLTFQSYARLRENARIILGKFAGRIIQPAKVEDYLCSVALAVAAAATDVSSEAMGTTAEEDKEYA